MIKDLGIDELGELGWNEFVLAHPSGSVFHHSAWHRVMERTYGLKARYLVSRDALGNIGFAMPYALARGVFGSKKLISYPFSDHCGPLLDEPGGFDRLLDFIRRGIRSSSIEIRVCGNTPVPQDAAPRYYIDIIRLENGPEAAYGDFHKDCVRRAIAKAERNGVEIVEAGGLEGMKAYYSLHLATRKRHGVPPQPFSFFGNVHETLSPEGMASVLFAVKDGRRVAGMITLRLGKKAYYKFGASSHACPPGANQLLMWRAMERAAKEGCIEFDLGRTAESNAGLMEYKARWGGERRRLNYFRLPERKRMIEENRLVTNVIKRLPVFSNRLIGELVYKYMA